MIALKDYLVLKTVPHTLSVINLHYHTIESEVCKGTFRQIPQFLFKASSYTHSQQH